MNGRILDVAAVGAVVIAFLAFAMFHSGVANLLVAWFGLVALGYYNVFVRHDRTLVDAAHGSARPVDHSATLRPAWR
ncbi:hypothetical protein [Nocardia seriolae]|uniref:hypothetical protein n=1 Tax=Nocardia seriolae TaxID=37332 RepID=UPI0008FF75B2|nr:hypothetical protein [Nocardia seriolae]PSK30753.1 hypothetical protein C6575_14325 [Nocardia seriolae]QOW31019.1 hypothetical protein IMZ23_23135 [Nocardia seriolae]QUN18234.1 hypothetical protein KEC46_01850 [Nocardia seriolae]WNJ61491.1 hypothetical protein RMO66_12845 [Nocardia seriolae]